MSDKRPLLAALLLIAIGVAAAVLFRKPADVTTGDADPLGESVLRRHEPVGLAAGEKPLSMPNAQTATPSTDTSDAPSVGLVGRITPVNGASAEAVTDGDGSISPSYSMTAVPPVDADEIQRLPDVTTPAPDYLRQPSVLSRQYPSTSRGKTPSQRQPAAATALEAAWPSNAPGDHSPAADDSDESTDEPHIRLHTVRDGDSLFTLAERFLGDSGRYLEIYEANRDVLRNPEQLPIGAQLRIPRGGKDLTSGDAARRPTGTQSYSAPHDPNRLVPVTPHRP